MESFQQPFSQQQSSFMPKKSLVLKPEMQRSYGIVTPLAVFLFLASVAVYGITYAYEYQLKGEAKKLQDNLAQQEQAFDPRLLGELQRLDSRMAITKQLLGKHVTLIPFFDFLSTQTIKGLRFSGLTYFSGKDASPQITLAGESKDYDAIALQSDIFGENPLVKEFLFSDLTLSKEGTVGFSLTLSLDPTLFSYNERLKQAQTQ